MMNERKNQDYELLSAKTLAEILSTSVRSIWRYRSSGRLPATVRIAGAIRWRRTDIEQWISLGCPSQKDFLARKESEKC
jgi:predicted DNA-binding transcriptional regulator AlpA